jgi:hypothetical protein
MIADKNETFWQIPLPQTDPIHEIKSRQSDAGRFGTRWPNSRKCSGETGAATFNCASRKPVGHDPTNLAFGVTRSPQREHHDGGAES